MSLGVLYGAGLKSWCWIDCGGLVEWPSTTIFMELCLQKRGVYIYVVRTKIMFILGVQIEDVTDMSLLSWIIISNLYNVYSCKYVYFCSAEQFYEHCQIEKNVETKK